MVESSTKLVIVTGANRGIGYGVVEKLLETETYRIVLTSRDEKRGEEAVKKLSDKFPKEKGRLIYQQLDVTSSVSIDRFVKWVADKQEKVHILINNAGSIFAADGKWYDAYFFNKGSREEADATWAPKEEIDDTINLNVHGLINLTEKLLPFLADNARVLNVSSFLGKLSFHQENVKKALEDPNLAKKENLIKLVNEYTELAYNKKHVENGWHKTLYTTSKSFVNAYTRWVLASNLKETQTAIAIHPGSVQTDLNKNGELTLDEGIYSTVFAATISDSEALALKGKYINEKAQVEGF